MSLRAAVRLGVSKRSDFPIVKQAVALLIIDVQRYCCNRSTQESRYYADRALPRMSTNIQRLLQVFRTHRDGGGRSGDLATTDDSSAGTGCEVIFVVIQSATRDRRDLSLDYKLSGPYFAQVPTVNTTYDEIFLPELMPDTYQNDGNKDGKSTRGDLVIRKTACSVFTSTNIKFVLNNLLIEQLVICGQLTDQCVESAVRDAADLGFLVTVVDDACAAHSADCHNKGLTGTKGFCRIVSTEQIVQEMNS